MRNSPVQYPLNIAAPVQTFRVPGALGGTQQIILACATYPSGGTVSVEYQLAGSNVWSPVPKGTLLPFVGPVVLYTYGAVAGYRVTLAGITGAPAALAAWVAEADAEGFPPGAFVGLRALTTQTYIEANVKNGVQYEASAENLGVAAGASIDVVVKTGANPVLVKQRKIDFNGARCHARVFRNTVFTAGSGVLVPYYNMNLRNAVAGTVEVRVGATVSDIGVEAGAPTFALGSTGQGQTALGSYALSGIERLLAPNSNYALRITNPNAAPMDITTYLSWYEGGIDLPV